jgi:hypothetical protein
MCVRACVRACVCVLRNGKHKLSSSVLNKGKSGTKLTDEIFSLFSFMKTGLLTSSLNAGTNMGIGRAACGALAPCLLAKQKLTCYISPDVG